MTRADRKANLAAQWDENARRQVQALTREALPQGLAAYTVGRTLIVVPALKPGAPRSMRRVYRDRVIVNATGRCPRCGAAAGIGASRAAIEHEPDCRVGDGDTLARWCDPAGVAAMTGEVS